MTTPPRSQAPAILNQVITFYSYKGGTGRTMALANVACLLARDLPAGQRILAVDWDLEAPGLRHYFRDHDGSAAGGPGVIELFTEVAATLDTAAPELTGDALAEQVIRGLSVGKYLRPSGIPNLDLMPAGEDNPTYGARLAHLNWEAMYQRCPGIYSALARTLAREYAAVLIDSRTGITDASGVCTALLPDKLVVVFTPNRQSLTGIEGLVRRALEYRRSSSDLRPMMLYPLPSRIEGQLEQLRAMWRRGDTAQGIEGYQIQFERILKDAYALPSCDLSVYCDEVQVQHSPEHSYGEAIAALAPAGADRLSIVRSYEALVAWLRASADPWERPETALARSSLEALLAEEAVAQQTLPRNDRQLLNLREEIVRAARAVRGAEHPETIAATGRLIAALLESVAEQPRAVELLDGLAGTVSSLAGAARWRGLDVVLGLAGMLRTRGRPEAGARIAASVLQRPPVWSPAEAAALDEVAARLQRAGWLEEARLVLQLVIDAGREAGWDGESPPAMRAMSRLGRIQFELGQWKTAAELQEQVLAVQRRKLGGDHPDTLAAMNDLAKTLGAEGQWAAARDLLQQALEGRRRVLGEEHSDTLTSMVDLAEVVGMAGDLDGARALEKQALATRTRVLGPDHPDTLSTMSNLAATLWHQGALQEARVLEQQVLETRRRVLGEEHPDTLTSMNNLAETLRMLGDLPAARALHERELEACRRVLGDKHPDTLASMNNVAITLAAMGDLLSARVLAEQVLDLRRQVLGADHPDTLTSANNLASILAAQGNKPRALEVGERVLAARLQTLGEQDADTLTSMSDVADLLWALGDTDRAFEMQARALEGRRRLRGEAHPDTLLSMSRMAKILRDRGQLPESRDLAERVLGVRASTLGDAHPDTLAAMSDLATTLIRLGDLERARALYGRELEARRHLGERDAQALFYAMSNLANVSLKLGDIDTAARLQDEILASQQRALKTR